MPINGDIIKGLGAERLIYRQTEKHVWYRRVYHTTPRPDRHARNRRAKWVHVWHHVTLGHYAIVPTGLPDGI